MKMIKVWVHTFIQQTLVHTDCVSGIVLDARDTMVDKIVSPLKCFFFLI